MNERFGSKRRAPSTIRTPEGVTELISARQRRAERGPKRLTTAMHSKVRDAYAGPVQIVKAGKGQRRRKHRDEPGRFTLNVGGSCSPSYVHGR